MNYATRYLYNVMIVFKDEYAMMIIWKMDGKYF